MQEWCSIINAVISTNSLNNMSLHTSLISPTHKITEDHKEHTELSKMLITNMHTCTKVVVKMLSVIIIYIKEEIEEIMEVCYYMYCNCMRMYMHACMAPCMLACTICAHVCWCVCA